MDEVDISLGSTITSGTSK